MHLFRLHSLSIVLTICAALTFDCLAAQDTIKNFIFGHSLIHHEFQVNPTPSQETSVPHWLHFLTEEAGMHYAVAGQYGFLPQHANLPPFSQWGFDVVAPAWDSDYDPFQSVGFDNVLITPGNFIQWQGPEVPYYGDTQSPLDYTGQIFDWVLDQEPNIEVFIYENWPDMGGYLSNGFPPTAAEWASYNNYLNNGFHQWFIAYHDSLQSAFPGICINMIPVGPIISEVLSISPYDQIPIDSLYEDDAPHGRPTIYFLAAMITYMAYYGQEPPASYQVPSIIHPIVAQNYTSLSSLIWQSLNSNQYSGLLCTGADCPSDLDMDGTVDIDDFILLNSIFGSTCTCPADINADGMVDVDDFLILNSNFGVNCQ